MRSLDWPDIFVDPSCFDVAELLSHWPGKVTGRVRAVGASAFGDLYFEREGGTVERLDILEGKILPVAGSFEEFQALMNTEEWRVPNLLTEGVALLLERGLVREPGQFFSFAPHPTFTGSINWSNVVPMSASVWHSIAAQSLGAGQ